MTSPCEMPEERMTSLTPPGEKNCSIGDGGHREDDILEQLVLPSEYRENVLKTAHKSL